MKQLNKELTPSFDRREFTSAAILALLGGVTITVFGCDSDTPSSPSPTGGDRSGSITGNHGHSAVLAAATISAGNEVSLDIRGEAEHPHTVVLSMAEVGQVAAGQRVSKMSSTDPSAIFGTHSHTVTFN